MIPGSHLRQWTVHAPWPDLQQVEQDLIICRALCDLFDLNEGLLQLSLDRDQVIACLQHYLVLEKHSISRANAEERMLKKLNQSLTEDIAPLLAAGTTFADDDAIAAFGRVWAELIGQIPGEPWKSLTVTAPDTEENQAVWPQSTSQQPGLGYPILRLCVLVS